jgi:hypothetical protein
MPIKNFISHDLACFLMRLNNIQFFLPGKWPFLRRPLALVKSGVDFVLSFVYFKPFLITR